MVGKQVYLSASLEALYISVIPAFLLFFGIL
jgi:hypothetical protein